MTHYPYRKSKSINRFKAVGVIALVVLVIGLVLSVLAVFQNQETRRRAAEGQAQVQLTVSSMVVDSQHLRVTVSINTQGNSLAGLDLRGTLSGATVTNTAIENGTVLGLTPVLDNLVPQAGDVAFRLVRFAPLDASSETSTHGNNVELFSFVLKQPQNNQVAVSFDSVNSLAAVVGYSQTLVSYPEPTTFSLTTAATTTTTATQSPAGATPVPAHTCNAACNKDADCNTGLFCYSNLCRKPYSPTDPSCPDRGGFFIRTFFDLNGDGYQQVQEPGLTWQYKWMSNNDNTWHDYATFAENGGEGGIVSLPVGTLVTIKELPLSGWVATNPTQPTTTIVAGETKSMVFGIWQPALKANPTLRPRPVTVSTPTADITTPVPTSPATPLATITPMPTNKVVLKLSPTPVMTPVATLQPEASTPSRSWVFPALVVAIGAGAIVIFWLFKYLRG